MESLNNTTVKQAAIYVAFSCYYCKHYNGFICARLLLSLMPYEWVVNVTNSRTIGLFQIIMKWKVTVWFVLVSSVNTIV